MWGGFVTHRDGVRTHAVAHRRFCAGKRSSGNDVRVTKAVIPAGGIGTRLAEEADVRPKPMVESRRVHLIDTGMNTSTGGWLKWSQSWLQNETFPATYGDGGVPSD